MPGADALAHAGRPAPGTLLATSVAGEPKGQATRAETTVDVHQLRDRGDVGVDLVLEARNGRGAGVEVEASMSVEGQGFRDLGFLHDRRRGVVAPRNAVGLLRHALR
jgi:hypothetical protein